MEFVISCRGPIGECGGDARELASALPALRVSRVDPTGFGQYHPIHQGQRIGQKIGAQSLGGNGEFERETQYQARHRRAARGEDASRRTFGVHREARETPSGREPGIFLFVTALEFGIQVASRAS